MLFAVRKFENWQKTHSIIRYTEHRVYIANTFLFFCCDCVTFIQRQLNNKIQLKRIANIEKEKDKKAPERNRFRIDKITERSSVGLLHWMQSERTNAARIQYMHMQNNTYYWITIDVMRCFVVKCKRAFAWTIRIYGILLMVSIYILNFICQRWKMLKANTQREKTTW